ncbi:hypothetical protein CBW65_11275 [Tumebacillus avium]|uniref:Uncharacterized protein n=1 Tax=Tumebacillus avium TaxID=1903704 RepID=A0A1Y0IPY3_9BACL|nr:hypothetical protein [Tumebacillus avium]ARU61525.1 hypothetical protein CBW65_11275 [Tumebacillus avium]
MIRALIVVKRKQGSDPTKDARLQEAAEAFARYLHSFRTEKSKESKHGKMGPIGKLLSRMRSGKRGDQVLGEAIRIHEMTAKPFEGQKSTSITVEQFNSLKEGVFKLTEVLDDPNTSPADHKRILETVDAVIYFRLEKARKENLVKGLERFRAYLQTKYDTPEELAEAWDDTSVTWEKIPFPTSKYDKNPKIKAEIAEYLAKLKEVLLEEDMDEEDTQA